MRKIGAVGSQSTAFVARQSGLEREVELRVLNRRIAEDTPAYQRFEREFRTLASLDHPALIQVHDLGVVDGRVYYTTDLREADTLETLLAGSPEGLDERQVFAWLEPVARALALLHARSVLHRGLTLDSIRVERDGARAYIAKFALLKTLKLPSITEKGFRSPDADLVQTPEQLEGWAETARTDVFLLGAVLYRCLTGRNPLQGLPLGPDWAPPPPTDLASWLPDEVDELVMTALAYRSPERWASMAEFAAAFGRVEEKLATRELMRSVGTRAPPVAGPGDPDHAPGDSGGPETLLPEELPPALRSSVVLMRDALVRAKGWLDEPARAHRKVATALGGVMLGAVGLHYLVSGTGAPPPRRRPDPRPRVTRARPAAAPRRRQSAAEAAAALRKAAGEAGAEPTTRETFPPRWETLKEYVKVLPRRRRLEVFPPAVMADLRVLSYRAPDRAAKRLDRLLAQAAALPGP